MQGHNATPSVALLLTEHWLQLSMHPYLYIPQCLCLCVIPTLQGSPDIHTWIRHTPKWIECSAGYVSTTALLLSQNGLRNDLRRSNIKKFPGGACLQTLPSLVCFCMYTCTSDISFWKLPPSENPGYRPDKYTSLLLLVTWKLKSVPLLPITAFPLQASWI